MLLFLLFDAALFKVNADEDEVDDEDEDDDDDDDDDDDEDEDDEAFVCFAKLTAVVAI